MLSAYSRVTVVGDSRTVDLALPTALPLADVVPQVLRYCAPGGTGEQPESWTLARLGGPALALAQSLRDSGVVDGEVLELRRATSDVRPAVVEDVRDAVEDTVDAAGGAWTPGATATLSLVGGSVLLTVVALLLLVPAPLAAEIPLASGLRSPTAYGELATALLCVTVLVAGAASAARGTVVAVGQACAAAAVVWGSVAGFALADAVQLDGGWRLLLGGLLAAATAVAARLVHPALTAHVAASALLLLPALAVVVVEAFDVDAAQVLRVAPVLALLASGVLPRVSLSVGGLASADYRVRAAGRLSGPALQARYRESHGLLVGALVAVGAVVVLCGAPLALRTESTWDPWLVLAISLVAMLRSRLFSRVVHVLPLRLAGVTALVVVAVAETVRLDALTDWTTALLAAAVLASGLVSRVRLADVSRARVKRLLDGVEFVVVIVLVVLSAGAVGVFGLLGSVF